MVPLGLIIAMVGTKISSISSQIHETVTALEVFIGVIEAKYQVVILSDSNLDSIAKFLSSLLTNTMGLLLDSLGSVVIMYFLLYYMLLQYRTMELWIFTKLPLQQQSLRLMGSEIKDLVISNAVGLPITALAQGILAGILYAFLAVDDWWFWFVLTSFTAMIPAVGAALAYLPLAMILYAQGNENQSIVLIIYGFTIIAAADNLVRMFLQKKMGNIHPLITILGVIVGLKLFGFLGLIFGPILLSFFRLLFKVYHIEFGDFKA
jgi:predicted PurR-regulated permease PerM